MCNRKNAFIPLVAFIILFGCTKDFVEPDLTGKKIALISPLDNDTLSSLTNIFWWNEIDGATKYNLQIAKPNFSSVQQFMLDTNITEDNFSFTLVPGTYQWRVRGYNGSSKTDYSIRSFTIDSTSSLTGQTVVLVFPANNYLTNSTAAISFLWDTLYNADDYRFQLINDSSGSIITDVIAMTGTFSYTVNEGEYTWQVRAQNATSNTLYSSRTFTIDITAPAVSVPTYPANGDTISSPDTLLWTRSADAVGDSLFIYPDSLISSPVYQGYTTNTLYIFTGAITQDYFWRLKSRDVVGNWSGYGTLRKFWVQ